METGCSHNQETNKIRIGEQTKEWHKNNPEKAKIIKKRGYLKHKDNYNERSRQYAINNPEKIREYKINWANNKRRTDLKFNLNEKISKRIRESLRDNKKRQHWETLVGYVLNDLIYRLKKTMPNGYNWNDVLDGKLHIDHIIPRSVFNFNKPEHADFKRCWALDNLRLLPAMENLKKGNKLTTPFQPALAI